MDQSEFSPGPDSYQSCKDWAEEVEVLLKDPLLTKSKAVQANWLILWSCEKGHPHIKSFDSQMQRGQILTHY